MGIIKHVFIFKFIVEYSFQKFHDLSVKFTQNFTDWRIFIRTNTMIWEQILNTVLLNFIRFYFIHLRQKLRVIFMCMFAQNYKTYENFIIRENENQI